MHSPQLAACFRSAALLPQYPAACCGDFFSLLMGLLAPQRSQNSDFSSDFSELLNRTVEVGSDHPRIAGQVRSFREGAHDLDQIGLAFKADAGQVRHGDVAVLDAHTVREPAIGLE